MALQASYTYEQWEAILEAVEMQTAQAPLFSIAAGVWARFGQSPSRTDILMWPAHASVRTPYYSCTQQMDGFVYTTSNKINN